MSLKRTIARHTLMLSSSTYLYMMLAAVTNFIVAKILGPTSYGIISGIQVIVIFSTLSNFGFMQAAGIRIPALRVKNRNEDIQKVLRITFVMVVVPASIIALIVMGIAFYRKGNIPAPRFWAMMTLAVMIVLYQVQQMVINTHIRGWNRFDIQSKTLAITAIIINPLMIIMVVIFGIYGNFGAQVIHLVIFLFIISRFIPLKFGSGWSWDLWKDMFSIGLPLMLTAFLVTSTGNIDRFIILNVLAGEAAYTALGIYTIGVRVMQFLHGVNMVVYSVMLPRFQERYAESNHDKQSLCELVEGPSLILTTVMSLGAAFSIIGCQYLVYNWMDEYVEGILAMKLLGWTSALFASSILISMVLITIDRNWLRFTISLISLIIISGGNYLALKLDYGISGVAVATLFGRFVDSLLYVFIVGKMLWPLKKTFSFYLRLNIPIASLMLILFLSDRWLVYGKGFISDIPDLLLQCSLVLAGGILCIFLLRNQTESWNEGIRIIKAVRKKLF